MVELIITIAIIAILAGSVLISIDPAKRLNTARNSRRQADVALLLDAFKSYQADHDGALSTDHDGNPATAAIPFVDADEDSVQIIGENPTCNEAACPGAYRALRILAGPLTCAVRLTFNGKTVSEPSSSGIPAFRRYLPTIPADPNQKGTNIKDDTRYYVNIDDEGIVTVGACSVEGEERGGGGTPRIIELEL